jgi:choline-sulfatase
MWSFVGCGLQYDKRNADNVVRWLQEHANDDKPWVLFASFVCPHPPYIAQDLPFPAQWQQADWPDHPAMTTMRHFFHLEEPFSEVELHKLTAAYSGVTTYVDGQIGRVPNALNDLGLAETTRVIYASDHDESLGARGLFGKFTMYEESAAIPFIMAGPDMPQGKMVNTPISLVDCFPTILEAVGAASSSEDASLPGESLWAIAQGDDQQRAVLSEYHALAAENAYFMLRDRQHKLIYHVNAPPQLFDLANDPDETIDLAPSPGHQAALQRLEQQLRNIVDPEAADAQAKADQRAKIEAFGGEDAVRQRGAFDNSPVPGEKPAFRKH